jgi:hypothetical protein
LAGLKPRSYMLSIDLAGLKPCCYMLSFYPASVAETFEGRQY